MLEIRLLGGFGLRWQGREVTELRPGRAQSLLVYLLLERESPQLRSRIAALFWPDTTEAQARTNLRRELHALRRALPGEERFLRVENRVLQWRSEGPWTSDLTDFQSALGRDDLEAALPHYGGELLPGCYEEWLFPYREALHSQYSEALERCAELREEKGDQSGALAALRTLLSIDPLREELYRRMMGICLNNGNRAQVSAVFRECEEVLQRELNLEPDPETINFYRQALETPRPRVKVSSDSPALVGRDQEWGVALRWLDSGLREGSSSMLLVSGEPGIGKTRLLEELKTELKERDGLVLSGRGFEAEQIRAYGPWLDLLKEADLLRSERALKSGDRSELFDPVVQHLGDLLKGRCGMLLVLDDLHWFDEASLALLHYAVRLLAGQPILFACSARAAELAGSQAQRAVSSLQRDRRLKELSLSALEPEAILKLVTAVNPVFRPESALACGGNPLFAVEMARGTDFSSESTINGVIAARLERLEALGRELVSWGAVLGRSFSLETLARVCARPLTEILEAVVELEDHKLWTPTEKGYDFAHDVVREAAYTWLSEPRRRLLHLQTARRLTGPAEIARHAGLGGDMDLASESYLKAAEESLRVLAFSEAAELARLGLQSCPTMESPRRRLELWKTAVYAGMTVEAMERLCEELHVLCQQAARRGIPEEEALAGQIQAIVNYQLERVDGTEAASLRVVEKARLADLGTAAHMVAHSASCLASVGRDMPRTEAVALEAQELARQAGLEISDLEHALGLVYQFHGDLDKARAHLERAVVLSRNRREPWQTCTCLIHLGCLLVEQKKTTQALTVVEEIRLISSPLRDESELAFADLLEALARGDDPTPTLEVLRQLDSKRMLAFGHRHQAQNCLHDGDLKEAARHAELGWEAARTMGVGSEQALCAATLIRVSLQSGQRQAAANWIRKIRRLPVSQIGAGSLAALKRAMGEGTSNGNHRGRGRMAGTLER